MKTRLLLFFFFVFSFGNAQINVVEGFESGAIPAGWGSIGFSLYNSSPAACNGNFSFYGALSASSTFRQLTTSSYISDGGQINVSFNYKRTIGAFVGIFRIYYEVNGSGTWTEVINTSSFSTSCVPLNGYISTGVIPAGSSVKFRMQINRTSGDTTTFIDDFSAVQTGSLPTGTIAEYNFDNTYNNILGANPFQANANTTFTTDRHGNISGALRIINQGTFATILGLPYNSTSRTISVWAKSNVLNSQINYVFHYGNSANGNGLAFRPTTTLYFANAGANLETADTNTNNTWIHYVCTYDGTTAKVYKNGVLFSSGVIAFNTINNLNYFKLGLTESDGYNYFNGAIDDLKIYNYALNATEISSLYTNNTLSTSDFSQNNLEVALYPNPVNDILNIETALELQSVEIYNIQGQKVLSSNQKQINVSDLAAGMYMVRIQDIDNNIATKKIVIK